MILAIDIGNTNIVVGCIDREKIYFVERLSTVRTKTELEYAIDLKTVLDIYHIKGQEIEGCIISSVVPQITNVARLAAEKILKKDVMVVGPGLHLLIVKAMFITPNEDPIGNFRTATPMRISLLVCVAGIFVLGITLHLNQVPNPPDFYGYWLCH